MARLRYIDTHLIPEFCLLAKGIRRFEVIVELRVGACLNSYLNLTKSFPPTKRECMESFACADSPPSLPVSFLNMHHRSSASGDRHNIAFANKQRQWLRWIDPIDVVEILLQEHGWTLGYRMSCSYMYQSTPQRVCYKARVSLHDYLAIWIGMPYSFS